MRPDTVVVLLGPRWNRLVGYDRNDPGALRTIQQLIALGWRVYTGPGRADARGWLVPGSDARVPVNRAPATDVLGRMVGP